MITIIEISPNQYPMNLPMNLPMQRDLEWSGENPYEKHGIKLIN